MANLPIIAGAPNLADWVSAHVWPDFISSKVAMSRILKHGEDFKGSASEALRCIPWSVLIFRSFRCWGITIWSLRWRCSRFWPYAALLMSYEVQWVMVQLIQIAFTTKLCYIWRLLSPLTGNKDFYPNITTRYTCHNARVVTAAYSAHLCTSGGTSWSKDMPRKLPMLAHGSKGPSLATKLWRTSIIC